MTGRTITLGRVLLVLASLVLITGTVVTGAGPHSGGGKKDDVSRLDLRIPEVARVHGTMVMIFLAAVLAMVWLLEARPRAAQRAPARHVAARRAGRAGGRRIRPVLQRHPRGPRRRAHRRRHRGLECGGRCCISAASNDGSPPLRPRPTHRCLHRPDPAAKLVRCRHRSASTGRGTSRSLRKSCGRRSPTPSATASGGRGCALHHRRVNGDGADALTTGRTARVVDPGATAVPAALHGPGRRRGAQRAPRHHRRRRPAGPGPTGAAADRRRHRGPPGVGVRAAGAVAPDARACWAARRWPGRTTASSNVVLVQFEGHALHASATA